MKLDTAVIDCHNIVTKEEWSDCIGGDVVWYYVYIF